MHRVEPSINFETVDADARRRVDVDEPRGTTYGIYKSPSQLHFKVQHHNLLLLKFQKNARRCRAGKHRRIGRWGTHFRRSGPFEDSLPRLTLLVRYIEHMTFMKFWLSVRHGRFGDSNLQTLLLLVLYLNCLHRVHRRDLIFCCTFHVFSASLSFPCSVAGSLCICFMSIIFCLCCLLSSLIFCPHCDEY